MPTKLLPQCYHNENTQKDLTRGHTEKFSNIFGNPTICKMVRPTLSDHCLSVLSVGWCNVAKSATVQFRLVVQLFAPPTYPAMHLAQKIQFITAMCSFFWVSTMSTQILGFSTVSA